MKFFIDMAEEPQQIFNDVVESFFNGTLSFGTGPTISQEDAQNYSNFFSSCFIGRFASWYLMPAPVSYKRSLWADNIIAGGGQIPEGERDDYFFIDRFVYYLYSHSAAKLISAQKYFDAAEIGDNEKESVSETRSDEGTAEGEASSNNFSKTRFDPINTASEKTSGTEENNGSDSTTSKTRTSGTTTREYTRDFARDAGETARKNALSESPMAKFAREIGQCLLISQLDADEYFEE